MGAVAACCLVLAACVLCGVAVILEGGEGITINTDSIVVANGRTFDISTDIPDGSYTLDEGYTLDGWTLYVDDVETDIPDGTFRVAYNREYRLVARLTYTPATPPEEITIGLEGASIDGVECITINTSAVQGYAGVSYNVSDIPESVYTVLPGYRFTGWTLYKDGEAAQMNQDGSFVPESGHTYTLVAGAELADIMVLVQDADGTTVNEITAKYGDTISLDDIEYTPAAGWKLSGWTITAGGEAVETDGSTITLDKDAEYIITPVLEEIYVAVRVESAENISITSGAVQELPFGSYSMEELVTYTLDTGYKLTGWTVTIKAADTESGTESGAGESGTGTDTETTIEAGGTLVIDREAEYIITPVTSRIAATLTILDKDGEELESRTVYGGETVYVSDIEYDTLDTECWELRGWILAIDGRYYGISSSFTVAEEGEYTLMADAAQIAARITLAAADGSGDYIEFSVDTILKSIGDTISISDISEDMYTRTKGYEIKGWTLYVDGTAVTLGAADGTDSTDGTDGTDVFTEIEIEAGKEYRLEAEMGLMDITVHVAAQWTEGAAYGNTERISFAEVTKLFGETFSLEKDIDFDISDYTGYEIKGYTLQTGEADATGHAPEDNFTFYVTEEENYTLTIYIGYINLTYTFCYLDKNDEPQTITSGTTHYGDTLDLAAIISAAEYTPETGWSLDHWNVSVAVYGENAGDAENTESAEQGRPDNTAYEITIVGDYTFVAVLLREELHVVAYDPDGNNVYTNNALEVGETIQMSDIAYSPAEDEYGTYELTGWALTYTDNDGNVTSGTTISADGSLTISDSGAYVLRAAVQQVTVKIAISLADGDEGLIELEKSSDSCAAGGTYTISEELYSMLDDNYEVTGWTLYTNGSADTETLHTGDSFTAEAATAYTLVPIVQGKEVTIQITDENGSSLGTYTARVGDSFTVAEATADITYTPAEWFCQDGWTLTVTLDDGGEPDSQDGQTVASRVQDDDIITIEDAAATYVLAPYTVEYGIITLSVEKLENNADKITLGAVDDEFGGEDKFIVGVSYALPEETEEYITLTEAYGIKSWVMYLGDEVYAAYAVDDEIVLSSGGSYTLVPVVEHYFKVTLADGIESFEMDDIRVYDGDELTLPEADASIISNGTGRAVDGWYLEDGDGNVLAVSGGKNGMYDCGAEMDEISADLAIWPVLEDMEYALHANDEWQAERGESPTVTDYAGTVLGTVANSVRYYISDEYRYDKENNLAIYTIVNSYEGTVNTLPEGYWFRLNTMAGAVTLTDNEYYDFFYALENYGSEDLTLTLYVCSNGYLSSDVTNTNGYTRSYDQITVTIPAGETVRFAFYAFDESGTPASDNFITLIQLNEQCTELALGIRMGIEVIDLSAVGIVYIQSVEGFTLNGEDWTEVTGSGTGSGSGSGGTDGTDSAYGGWMFRRFSEGNEIQLTDDGISYSIEDGYVLLGWYALDNTGEVISSLLAPDHTFRLSTDSVYYMPLVALETEAYTNIRFNTNADSNYFEFAAEYTPVFFTYFGGTVVLPEASDVINTTGRTLAGWYVTDNDGNIYGTSANGIYALGASIAVAAKDGDLVISPVYTDTVYVLDVNGAMTGSYATDESGTAVGSYNRNDNLNSYFSSGTKYNANDRVEEFVIYSSSALASGSWFRLNTYATAAGVTLTEGGSYDISYAITNYSDTAITISVYHCTNGYLNGYPATPSDTSNYAVQTGITIEAGATYYFTFDAFSETITPDGNNFITIIEVNGDVSALALGVRIGIAETEETVVAPLSTPEASYDPDTGIITITAADADEANYIEGYLVSFFPEDSFEAVYTKSAVSGEEFTMPDIDAGTYDLRIQALSSDYTVWEDSYLSDVFATVTIS